MIKFFYPLIIIVLSAASHLSYAQNTNYEAQYKLLLSRHVFQGTRNNIETTLINYDSWALDSDHSKTMDLVQKINPDLLEGKEKMAFWINAYNLLTIDLIIKTGEKTSIKNQGRLFRNVWKVHHWKINNKKYTLDNIEHKILRPMGDPRIHMVINCASLSCPDLRTEPFEAKILDKQLEDQTMLFIQNQSKGVKITKSGLQISKIFDWFSKDFGGSKGVISFINKRLHTNSKPSKYLDYDWSLNSQF